MRCDSCPAAAVTTVPAPLCAVHATAFFRALLAYAMQAREPISLKTAFEQRVQRWREARAAAA